MPDAERVSYRLKQIDNDGTFSYSKPITVNLGSITNVDDEVLYTFSLEQNYPNPFNPMTNIKFSIPQNGFVSLKVYNVLSKEIAELVNKELSAGNYTVQFSADAVSQNLSSGVYFYRLESRQFSQTKKLILVK